MLYKVTGTFKGRVFSNNGNYKEAIPTPKCSYKETFYITEHRIARIDESNHTLVLLNSVGLDIYELDEEEFKNLLHKLDFK